MPDPPTESCPGRHTNKYTRTATCRPDVHANQATEQGKQVKYAEAFGICEYGRRPSAEQVRQLFPFFPPR